MAGPITDTQAGTSRLRLLLLSGSLRAGSTNSRVLELAARLGERWFEASTYADIATLPAFSPDVESLGESHPSFPSKVRAFRAEVVRADAMLLSTPEYAHGMPGSLKNALDWLVGGSGLPHLPVGVINVSPRSLFATPQLIEVMRTMSAEIIGAACLSIGEPLREDPDAERRWHERLTRAIKGLHDAASHSPRADWR